MNEKPDKKAKPTGKERDKRPPAVPAAEDKAPKKKPGDAARKMREMFKGAE